MILREKLLEMVNKDVINDEDYEVIEEVCSFLKLKMGAPLKYCLYDGMELCGKINKAIWFDVERINNKWQVLLQKEDGEEVITEHSNKTVAFLNSLIYLLSQEFKNNERTNVFY